MSQARNAIAAVIGLAAAAGVDAVLRDRLPRHRIALQAAGLTTAALIYPAARSQWKLDGHALREVAGVAAFGALGAWSGRAGAPGARALAGGWASHALFDWVHDGGHGSRIPGWYPAMCAGYDLATATALLLPAESR